MRGTTLPRDARDQVARGEAVDSDQARAGDLLFFHDRDGSGISHVALLGDAAMIVHSAVAAGGVVRESWNADGGTLAAALRPRLAAVRRIP